MAIVIRSVLSMLSLLICFQKEELYGLYAAFAVVADNGVEPFSLGYEPSEATVPLICSVFWQDT